MAQEKIEELKGIVKEIKTIEEYNEKVFQNMKNAYIYLELVDVKNADIFKIHDLIFEGVYEYAGNEASRQVCFGGGTFGAHPEYMQKEYQLAKNEINTLFDTQDPLMYAYACVFEHVRLIHCHFFTDGNTRVNSLILEKRLEALNNGLPLQLPYGKNNKEYMDARKAATQHMMPNMAPMLNYVLKLVGEDPLGITYLRSPYLVQPNYKKERYQEEDYTNPNPLMDWIDRCFSTSVTNYDNTWLCNFNTNTLVDLIDSNYKVNKQAINDRFNKIKSRLLSVEEINEFCEYCIEQAYPTYKPTFPFINSKKQKENFVNKKKASLKNLHDVIFSCLYKTDKTFTI